MSNTSMNTEYGLHRDGSGNLQNLRSYLNGIAPADTLVFGTVAEMTDAVTTEGTLIQTKGFYSSNGVGAATYLNIGISGSPDGFVDHIDGAGNTLKFIGSVITPSQAGAVFDGVTDDSPSISAIVVSGINLHNTDIGECFMSTAVDVNTDNYQITGMGKQTAFRSAGNEPCFRLNGSDQLVYNCGFAGDGTRANTVAATTGALVRILGDRGAVIGCNFYQYRFGVEARGAIDSPKVKFNTFREGLNEATDDHTVVGTTIDIRTNDNDVMENPEVIGNDLKDGIGSGIDFYAQDSTSDGSYRSGTSTGGISGGKIALNKIKHGFQYGIQLYRRGGSGTLNVSRVNVTDNEIDDITGETVNANSGTRIYGTGIYNQGAEDTLIQGNIVSRTCKATNDNTLTPAGIGVINAASTKVIGNEVNQVGTQSGATATAGGVGIWTKNTNVTPNNATDGFGQNPSNKNIKVGLNTVRSTLFQGIYGQDVVNFSASESNDVAQTGSQGIYINYSGFGFFAAEYSACPNPTVDDNIVNNSTTAGIEFDGVENFSGDDNRITNAGTEGIRVSNAESGGAQGNNITDPVASNHIVLTSSVSPDVNITDNICDGGATHQIRSFTQAKVKNNIHKNIAGGFSAVSYVGASTSNSGWWPLADGDTTPSIFNSPQLQTSNTGATTITAFDDIPEGHEFSILIIDGNTTVQFSGPSLSGNNGVDLVATSGTLLLCRYRGGITYCTIS